MQSFRDVISKWPSLEALAKDAAAEVNTVKQWRTRDKIPDEKWLAVAEAARKREIKGVTVEKLAALSAAKAAA